MATYKRRRSFVSPRAIKRRKVYKRTRRVFKRRLGRRINRFRISRPRTSVFPNKLRLRCNWTNTHSVNVADAVTHVITPALKINSLFDPDTALTGWGNVSSTNFQTVKNIYNKYTVHGAKITVFVRPITMFNVAHSSGGTSTYSGVSDVPIRWGLFVDDNFAYNEIMYEEFIGRKIHNFKDIQPNNNGGPGNTLKLQVKWSRRKWFGRYDDNQSADFSHDPASLAYAMIYYGSLDQNSTPVHNSYMVTWSVSFIAEFHTVKDNANNHQG